MRKNILNAFEGQLYYKNWSNFSGRDANKLIVYIYYVLYCVLCCSMSSNTSEIEATNTTIFWPRKNFSSDSGDFKYSFGTNCTIHFHSFIFNVRVLIAFRRRLYGAPRTTTHLNKKKGKGFYFRSPRCVGTPFLNSKSSQALSACLRNRGI